ncbi:hypothetical protein BVC80_8719g4 [Macleaya cordata]|uniref:Uncharacterized protein n=1 Tax=Macleaya cordata TaxID=56857 RepID=A0A200R7U6_MACCD|nr:hypothetical protein BVC80_8719g4 [Macleaya cordata]
MGSNNKGDSGDTGSTFRLVPKQAYEGSLSKGAVVNKNKEKISEPSFYGNKASSKDAVVNKKKEKKGDDGDQSSWSFPLKPRPATEGSLSKGAVGNKYKETTDPTYGFKPFNGKGPKGDYGLPE